VTISGFEGCGVGRPVVGDDRAVVRSVEESRAPTGFRAGEWWRSEDGGLRAESGIRCWRGGD